MPRGSNQWGFWGQIMWNRKNPAFPLHTPSRGIRRYNSLSLCSGGRFPRHRPSKCCSPRANVLRHQRQLPGERKGEFETHITGLSSTLLYHLDGNVHQIVLTSDDGDRTIKSRGLTFLSGVVLTLLLKFGPTHTIAAEACALTPHFLRSNQSHGELAIK